MRKLNTKISEKWLSGMAMACLHAASNESNANQPGTKIAGAVVVLVASDGSIAVAGSNDPELDDATFKAVSKTVISALESS